LLEQVIKGKRKDQYWFTGYWYRIEKIPLCRKKIIADKYNKQCRNSSYYLFELPAVDYKPDEKTKENKLY